MEYNAMIALTDYDWVACLRKNLNFNEVNFWPPTPWDIRKLKRNGLVFFLLKAKYGRKICGYGEYLRYEELALEDAWGRYGQANGVYNFEELKDKISAYASKSSRSGFHGLNHIIGCVILHNIVLLDEEQFYSPSERGWEVPNQVVKFKYIDASLFYPDIFNTQNDFELVKKGKKYKVSQSKERKSQSKFRTEILAAYNYECCISGEKTIELLEAAHIQEYISEDSNNLQNGLLLRADLHKLFDAGLITISKAYKVIISNQLKSSYYNKEFRGKAVSLPKMIYYPSQKALQWHFENVFRK